MRLGKEIWGKGIQPAIFLHGFTGNAHAWDHLRPEFDPHLRAIAVDLPGHGASPQCEGFDQTLDALAQLLDELHLSRVDLIGYSLGARVALGLALKDPTRIRRLVLESVNPGLRHHKERAARAREDALLAGEIEAHGVPAFVDRWESLPSLSGLRRLSPEMAAELRARRLQCTPDGLASALHGLGLGVQPNHWNRLPNLRVPTLVIAGGEDLKFSKIARAVAAELPLGWARALEGCGHAPHLERPAAYAREVLAFLQAGRFEADCPEEVTWMHS